MTASIAPGVFSPAEARRLVIVGDVHGCFAELLELLEKVALQPEDLLISVGDLVDRGPQSPEVVHFFRERPNTIVLMGNHERKHARAVFSYAQEITRLQFGASYGETVEWMRTLPYFYEDARVRVVHAALVPGLPLAEQRLDILSGTTSGERELAAAIPEGHWHEHYRDDKPVVAHALASRLVEEFGPDGFSAAARRHPATALLFQARTGRLDEPTMAKLCLSPQRTRDFAAQLEVPLPPPPAPLQ